MDDYSEDDLKQLFSITNETEYICINMNLFEKILELVKSTSNLDKSLKTKLTTDLNVDISNLEVIAATLEDYDKDKYNIPSILKIDFTEDDLMPQFISLFSNCKKLLTIMNDSMNNVSKIQHNIKDYIKNIIVKIEYYISLFNTPVEPVAEPVKKSLFKPKPMFQRKTPQTSPQTTPETQAVSQTVSEEIKPVVCVEKPKPVQKEQKKDKDTQTINKTTVEKQDITEISTETISKISEKLNDIVNTFHTVLTDLEEKKTLIESCKKTMQEFKSKGLNVDTSLAPLEAQEKEINSDMLIIVNKFNNATNALADVIDIKK